MENLALSLIIGISSSLVATLLFILLSELVRKVLLPWYSDKIYRGVRIDGEWACQEIKGMPMEPDGKISMSMNLNQKGELVTGTYVHKLNEHIDEYIVQGRIRDMCFLATAVPKSNRHVDAMSFLFHIDNVKSKLLLTGGALIQDKPSGVKSVPVRFVWKDS